MLGAHVRGALLALAAVVLLAPASRARAGDAFLCARSKPSKQAPRFLATTVEVRDPLATRPLRVAKPQVLCVPVDAGTGIADPATQLLGFKVRAVKGGAPYATDLGAQVVDDRGELYTDVKWRPRLLLVPSAVDASSIPAAPDPQAHALDHYRCRDEKPAQSFAKGQQIVLQLASGPVHFDLKKPHRLCEPVDALGLPIKHAAASLQCYKVKRAKGESKPAPRLGLHVNNQFGPLTIDALREAEICLPARAIARCNGARQLCDRAYDAVSYPTTHNAMSNAEEGWLGPNQDFGITRQLDDGVRALMLDLWYFGGDVVLCHGGDVFPCDLTGMKPLVDGLAEIKDFLDRRPDEVVSIIFESYVSEADVSAAFVASGLIDYVHAQPLGDPWPTLRQLIAANTRLVVFTDDSSASLPWHHYVWHYAWETPFSAAQPSDFTCAKNRGSLSNSLFILNHFLTQVIGRPDLAAMVNYDPFFVDRALQCESESGRLPNFVTVDYYDIGDLFSVVDTLNGLAP
jgi:hypothetical protein